MLENQELPTDNDCSCLLCVFLVCGGGGCACLVCGGGVCAHSVCVHIVCI